MDTPDIINKDILKSTLELIAAKAHTHKAKQDVKMFGDRLTMACPICGDSEKSMYKKRGNLYISSLLYVCYNCGDKHGFLELAKMFEVDVDVQVRLNVNEHVSNHRKAVKWNEEEFIAAGLDKLLEMSELVDYFERDDSELTNFRPVTRGSMVYNYLVKERKIHNHANIYEATYWHNPKWSENVLVNINQYNGKVLGIQLRNLKSDRRKRLFKIYTFSELFKNIRGEELVGEEKIGYDKLSQLYNILNIDWAKPITVFEGYLDTVFFPNSIGCVGTNTDVSILFKLGANLRFFYDHDATGVKKTKQHLRQNHTVFLWEKLFEWWAGRCKNPHSTYRKLKSNLVDLNDVAKVMENPYERLKLEEHFSKDTMDILFVRDIPQNA
jgi:hypothetical protein